MNLYHGLTTRRLSNGILYLDALAEVGPRIVRFGYEQEGVNLLAETPDLSWETPHGRYHLRGGHRLWEAPETVERTYIPDDAVPAINITAHSMTLSAPVGTASGIQKTMHIHMEPDKAILHIDHSLTNLGPDVVDLAVWPITQLPLGGTFILPLFSHQNDPDGKLPNRNLSLWPYSRINDPRIHLDDDVILLEALDIPKSNKLGYLNRHGWLAYIREDILLVKHFTPLPEQRHVDMGCNVEVYLSGLFVEMETLSPWWTFSPGETISHSETWQLYRLTHPPDTINTLLSCLRDESLPVSLKEQPAP